MFGLWRSFPVTRRSPGGVRTGLRRCFAHPFRPCVELLEGRLAPATLTVRNLNDSGPDSLRQAILDANSQPGDDTIVFASGLTGAINLTSALPDVTSNIDIQ